MKTTFYCVQVEFYDYGKQMALLTSRSAVRKPENSRKEVHGLSAFKVWFVSEKAARKLVIGVNNKEFDFEDVSWLLAEMGVAA